MMSCPYCGSKRAEEEYTVRTYDLPLEWVAINQVICSKCGARYSKTIRENTATGKRRVSVSKKSYLTGEAPVKSASVKRYRLRLFGRWRR